MKTIKIFTICLFTALLGYSQGQPNLENYPFGPLDVNVFVMPFDMDFPIKIGTMSKSGQIQFDFPSEIKKTEDIDTDGEFTKLWFTLFPHCDYGIDMISENDNMFSFDGGTISLFTSDNRYVGVVFTVSNEDLLPWIEDPAYMEPILASYYKLVYVTNSFSYEGECVQTRMMENGEAQISYAYNLNLKAGFNFIEYKIEHIYKTDPNVMASFPDKLTVTSVDGIPNCKWIGKYF